MAGYKAPLDDIRFVLNEVVGVGQLASFKAFDTLDAGTVNEFLNVTAQLSEDVLAPLNRVGDEQGCSYDLSTKSVKTPDGFKDAYKQFCEMGLTALSCDPAFGGMGMPQTMNIAIGEMFCSANLSFGMYPGLSHGAYNALHEYGTDDQKNTYLPKLVSGEWSGTMCLTEPGCGTDLGLMKTKATKQEDGTYKLSGEKIFISAGEHDLTENICHLVLAKIDDPSTPEGIKGVSLFMVPKFIPDNNGAPGERNGVNCTGLEEKMGIHGNATCKMHFDGAVGQLVGEPHKGMKAMFVMMNEARLGVGLQGLGLSEAAYQNALTYAQERLQGRSMIGDKEANSTADADPIIVHPDVRRELLTMKSTVEGERALIYWVAHQLDVSQQHPDDKERRKAQKVVDLLTPVIKAHFTDNAVDNTNSGIQVYGGHGYIREHGMEQLNRDARITRLYEGANGIQALDLIGRKVLQQNLLPSYLKVVEEDLKKAKKNGVSSEFTKPVEDAVAKLRWATRKLQFKGLMNGRKNMGKTAHEAAGISNDYLKMLGLASMGHMWVKMVDVSQQRLDEGVENRDFYETKIKTARFYMQKQMPQVYALAKSMKSGTQSLMDIASDHFAHRQTNVAEEFHQPQPKQAVPKQRRKLWPW